MAQQGLDLSKFPVLVVDDEQDNLDAFRFNFGRSFKLLLACSGEEALELARRDDVAAWSPTSACRSMTGLDLLRRRASVRPDAIGIIVTAFTDVDVLIEAINLGRIYRYVTKPWDSKEMRGILIQAVERFPLVPREPAPAPSSWRRTPACWRARRTASSTSAPSWASRRRCARCCARVEQVAQTSATVLLRGETGTGKEMVARAIHINSARESRPFVRVNCAALAPGVLESELFGHEKGAFTGAVARRLGRFELADGGTLFLDEIGDLPPDVQVKLLRVLQEREFERVGGSETIKVDVRVVSATHRDLEQQIADGTFREDLYYRLNVFPIMLPPLRERAERHRAAGRALRRRSTPAPLGKAGAGPRRRRRRRAGRLRLAGQRARARERHRARADPGARHRGHRGRPRVHAAAAPAAARRGRHRSAWLTAGARAADGGRPLCRAAARAGAHRDRRRHRHGAGQHRPRRARASASTGRRSTTGCASTGSNTSCR